MVKLQAIIRPDRLDGVVERLGLIGVDEVVVSEVRGFGRTGGRALIYQGSAYEVAFVGKVMIEWYGEDDDVDAVIRAIEKVAHTGNLGDGRIFVSTVDYVVDVRADADRPPQHDGF
jgi:nitrogen regulatory protein P-II 1